MTRLKPVSELGLAGPTDIVPREDIVGASTPEQESGESGGDEPRVESSTTAPTAPRPTRDRRHWAPAKPLGVETQPAPKSPETVVGLADEPTIFVQIMVPGELQERLADASHALAAEHRKLRHHKTILGALLWRYVEPDDPELLWQLGVLLDAYLETDLSEAPAEIKVGAHLPFSLKYKLEGAALALRRTRRAASAKTLLSALIWRYVDAARAEELAELLAAYRDAARPRPLSLGPSTPEAALGK